MNIVAEFLAYVPVVCCSVSVGVAVIQLKKAGDALCAKEAARDLIAIESPKSRELQRLQHAALDGRLSDEDTEIARTLIKSVIVALPTKQQKYLYSGLDQNHAEGRRNYTRNLLLMDAPRPPARGPVPRLAFET
jgi:hypothetical protein